MVLNHSEVFLKVYPLEAHLQGPYKLELKKIFVKEKKNQENC